MLIKNKSDPIIHIKNLLERRDLNSMDKIFVIGLLIEPYIQLEFSPTEYSNYLGVSRGTLYRSMDRLSGLNILKRHQKRYKYIIDCQLL